MTHSSGISIVIIRKPLFIFLYAPWSTHAPPSVWANLNLPAVSVFSRPPPPTWHPRLFHLHPKYQLRLLPSLPSSCAHVFLSLSHTPEREHERVSPITWPILPPMSISRNISLRHAAPVIFRSYYLAPVLSHRRRPGHVLQPAWLMSNCFGSTYSLRCVLQEPMVLICIVFHLTSTLTLELGGPAAL